MNQTVHVLLINFYKFRHNPSQKPNNPDIISFLVPLALADCSFGFLFATHVFSSWRVGYQKFVSN
jgi:hypothetical protein